MTVEELSNSSRSDSRQRIPLFSTGIISEHLFPGPANAEPALAGNNNRKG